MGKQNKCLKLRGSFCDELSHIINVPDFFFLQFKWCLGLLDENNEAELSFLFLEFIFVLKSPSMA